MKPGLHKLRRLVVPAVSRVRAAALLTVLALPSGCATVTDPMADSVPARLLPAELLGPSKAGLQTIPLNVLRQPTPAAYKLDQGDVLGITIDGIVGDNYDPLPMHVTPLVQSREQHRLPPASGGPFPVLVDGTIALPAIPKLSVKGMTLDEAREAIRASFLKKELISADHERVSVTLLQPRQYQVMVLRQEASAVAIGPDGPQPAARRNTGRLINLPAYQNDVLHALIQTGGLPDFDVYNEIVVYRDRVRGDLDKIQAVKQIEMKPADGQPSAKLGKPSTSGAFPVETIRIPLRVAKGAPLPFGPDDILLRTGDVVFLEARDEQVFFTAGLLPSGKHVLPRDQDLDVLQAIAQARGQIGNGAGGASTLVIVRRVAGRGQVRILVDLQRALRDPTERILVQPGDLLVL